MSNVVISVENLSKEYHLGQIGTGTLSDDLKVWWAKKRGKPNPFLKIGQTDHANRDGGTIFALRDINFSVEQGDTLGIIGRNGAGKSTLLKILSRVTAPTSGLVKVKGRIASLLEVGTGFHPDLTGRENTYLNGAILGMTRQEVRRKLDEIVEFAEIEKFLDTPVKRYSSGMYVRLAFAVAAHLDPEILVVDEVLAVGDAAFQKKCLGKMGDVAKGGRTVLFVSHNMAAVSNLCRRAILLESGVLKQNGSTDIVIDNYLNQQNSSNTHTAPGIFITEDIKERSGIGGGRISKVELRNSSGEYANTFSIGESIHVEFEIKFSHKYSSLIAGLEIYTASGILLLSFRSDGNGIRYSVGEADKHLIVKLDIPGLPFYPGSYYFEPWFCETLGKRIDHVHRSIKIFLESRGFLKSENMIYPGRGILLMDGDWE